MTPCWSGSWHWRGVGARDETFGRCDQVVGGNWAKWFSIWVQETCWRRYNEAVDLGLRTPYCTEMEDHSGR